MGSDEWTTTRLGQVVAINPDAIGRDWPYPHIRYIDISSVGVGQIKASPQWMKVSDAPSRAKRLVRKGDTVLSTVRPNRRSMFFASQPDDEWVVSTGFAVLRPKMEFVDPRFLYACIFNHSFTEYLITREKGAAYPAVSPEDIAKAEIPLPPLKEQQAIACILGALDDKIELNRRMNETLEAMARAIFKSWFIDFDPVKRNMARKAGQNQPSPPTPLPMGEGRKSNYRGGFDFSGLLETARELRKKQTPAETVFWKLIRGRRFMGLKFRRQHQLGDYVVDFYYHEHRLVIELDGSVHASKQKKDHKRDAWMKAQGFKVLRFPNEQVLEDPQSVLEQIAAHCSAGRGDGSFPLPVGEGHGEERGVRGEGSFPLPLGEGQGEGLPDAIRQLFPDAFEESELGEIPRGWDVRPIGDVVKVLGGGTPSTKEPTYWEGGVHPFCTPKDMSSLPSPVLLGTERHLTDDGLAKVSSGQLPKGTVLLSSRAPIGYLAVAETPVSVNQGIIAMVCDGELPNLYVLQWAYANMERIIANANGSTFLEISKRNFRLIKALVPPELVLEQFMRLAGPLHQRLVSNLRQVLYLANIRDTLLPRLISGELRVADAERIVGLSACDAQAGRCV